MFEAPTRLKLQQDVNNALLRVAKEHGVRISVLWTKKVTDEIRMRMRVCRSNRGRVVIGAQ
jgi:hypothetical protein